MTDPLPPLCANTLPGLWTCALVERTKRNGEGARRWEIIDLDPVAERLNGGNLRYPCESMRALRFKCAFTAAALPLYTAAYMLWHAVRGPLSALYLFFQTFEQFLGRPSPMLLKEVAIEAPKQALRCFWLALRAPFYMLAMQSTALYGVWRPLDGIKLSGAIERQWKRGATFRDDFRRIVSDEDARSLFWRACTARDYSHTCYLAQCFQPYGTLNDPSVSLLGFASDLDAGS